jgi:DNA-binding transcriptional MerR regulator
MRRYSIKESAQLLGVSRDTLRRWKFEADLPGVRGISDRRRTWLTRPELATLARLHDRVLVVSTSMQEIGTTFEEIKEAIHQLQQNVTSLTVRVRALGLHLEPEKLTDEG